MKWIEKQVNGTAQEDKWKRKAWIINLIFHLCNQCLWGRNCHFWHGSNCFWPVEDPLTQEREVVEHIWSVSDAPESRTRPPFRSSSPTADYDQQQKLNERLVQHCVLFKSNLHSAQWIWLRWKLWLQETPCPEKYIFNLLKSIQVRVRKASGEISWRMQENAPSWPD